MDGATERRTATGAIELRDGKAIGVAMVYGDRAPLGRGVMETFAANSLRSGDGPVAVNVSHRQTEIVDAAARVEFREDQVTVEFDAAPEIRERIKAGLNRMSVEFRALAERFDTASFTREIREAVLLGVAITDRPAYTNTAVEARNRQADTPDWTLL